MRNFFKGLRLLRRNFGTLLRFELLYKGLTLLFLFPALYYLFRFSFTFTGYPYLTRENYLKYARHPFTITMLLLILVLFVFFMLYDYIAVTYIYDCSYHDSKTNLRTTLRYAGNRLWGLLRLRNLALFPLTLVCSMFFSISIFAFYLTYNSTLVYNTLQEIAAYWYAPVLLVVIALASFVFCIRRIFVYHTMMTQNCHYRAAVSKNKKLLEGVTFGNACRLLLLKFFLSFVFLFFAFLGILLIVVILHTLVDHNLVYSTALGVVIVYLTFLFLLFLLFTTPTSFCVISLLYYNRLEALGEKPLPLLAPACEENARLVRLQTKILAGITLVFAVFCILTVRSITVGDIELNIEYLKAPDVTAHRGYSDEYPENTMLAFQGAVEADADYIELDVQQTKDGQIIVMHDRNLKRTTGVNKNIWQVTYEEIKDLDCGSFKNVSFAEARIPLLSEVLAYAAKHNVKLNIELKPTGHETNFELAVVNLIQEYKYEDMCCIASMKYDCLKKVKELTDEIPTLYVMSIAYGDISALKAADAYSIKSVYINSALVGNVHNAGKEIYAWTVNTEKAINQMINVQVDNIITDKVPLAKELIRENRSSRTVLTFIQDLISLFE